MNQEIRTAIARELMFYRRGIEARTLDAMSVTLPLSVEMALGLVALDDDAELYRKAEKVEVFDSLRAGWWDAVVTEDQMAGAVGVWVKVYRISKPVFLTLDFVRRPGPYMAYGGQGRSSHGG